MLAGLSYWNTRSTPPRFCAEADSIGLSGEAAGRSKDPLESLARRGRLELGDGRWLRPGDVVELEVEGIGVLRNRVGP